MWDVITGFDPAVLSAFIAAGLLLNITPGADFLFITACGISGGPRIGVAAALGVNIGVTLHVLLAAAGVSAMLLAYPASYQIIKYLGAAYLCYLAIHAWRSTGDIGTGTAAPSVRTAIKRGFLTNVLNPKTMLFIFAFIPQFTDPTIGPIWMQILILGAIFQLFGFMFVMVLGFAAGLLANALRLRVKILNKISAILFGGIAAKLVID